MSMDEAIKLVNSINVGNKKYMMKTNCEYCGKEIEKFVSVYLKNKHTFCSHDCYWNYKKEVEPKGSEHPSYNRIVTNCTNCGKEIKITPFDYNKTNQYGDNHNFCSQQCYWDYRRKYYIGDKSSRIGSTVSEEQLEKMMVGLAKWCKDDKRLNSNIQLKVNSILDKNNIKYEREYLVKYYSVDNYLTDLNLMIEVMGDYWHGSPLKYNAQTTNLNKTQQKDIQYDKQKHTYVKRYREIEILYLWEKDIDEHIELCEKLILEYIKNIEELTQKRIAEIRALPDTIEIKGTKYYVSNDGDDSNDGKTPETAWQTLTKVSETDFAAGDGVLFRRGDLFRGFVKTRSGVTYAAARELAAAEQAELDTQCLRMPNNNLAVEYILVEPQVQNLF